MEELVQWRGWSVEWRDHERMLLSRGADLYEVNHNGEEFRYLGTFPLRWSWKLPTKFRALQRVLRAMYTNVIRFTDASLLTMFAKDIALLKNGQFQKVSGALRPLRVLRGACAFTQHERVYFGEYIDNSERGEIHVYCYEPHENMLQVAYTFRAGEIRHVHGVYRDPYSNDLWCLTGDLPTECRILRSSDEFQTLDQVGSGEESWRAVSLQFTADAIWYGTDAQFAQNHLYRIDRVTGERKRIAALPGPVYYSAQTNDGLFFAVTAELCPSQTDRHATLWHVDGRESVNRIAAIEKDSFSNKYFMHGTLNFPCPGESSDELLFHGVALRQADNRIFRSKKAA